MQVRNDGMLIFAGLGNPGGQYAGNRHNIGFMAIDAMARAHGFGPARSRFSGLAQEGSIGGERITALKPLTYMNDSGASVQAAAAFFKLPPEAITAFHDELDLIPGKVRVKRGGGAAGHNGLRSMDRQLGSQDYWRVRLGIGHPGDKARVLGWVLGDFARADAPWLDTLFDAVADASPMLAAGKPEDFMTRVALLTGQDSPPPKMPGKPPKSVPETAPEKLRDLK